MATKIYNWVINLMNYSSYIPRQIQGENDKEVKADVKLSVNTKPCLSAISGRNVPQVASKISHNIWMLAVLHHHNFLLYDRKVITC